MIYALLYPLSSHFHANVLRYVPFRVLCATMTAMLLTFGLYPWFIRRLQRKQIGQVVRREGPESHFSKAGTPTMGGALILLALVLATVLWADPANPRVWVVTASSPRPTAWWATWTTPRRSRRRARMASPVATSCSCSSGRAGGVRLALHGRGRAPRRLDRGAPAPVGPPFLAFDKLPHRAAGVALRDLRSFVMVGTSNAVNLTDGLDGLAIGPVMVNAGTYAILAYLAGLIFFGNNVAGYLRHPVGGRRERAAHLLRLGHRLWLRLPLVQHVPRAGLHGRRGLAGRSAAASARWPSPPRTSC
jgi:phospho-N-acetylmuramoyl-pentapeptide-transferase